LPQGESGREAVKKDILRVLSDNEPRKFSDFIELVNSGCRGSVAKYLKELVIVDHLIVKYAGDVSDSFRPRYKLTSKGLKFSRREQFRRSSDLVLSALMLAPELSKVFSILIVDGLEFREDVFVDGKLDVRVRKVTMEDWAIVIQGLARAREKQAKTETKPVFS